MSGSAGPVEARRTPRRGISLAVLIVNQLLAGIGVASGIAVAGLLLEDLTGTAVLAGLGQTASVLGAGLAAVPLARIAVARGRHVALAVGYAAAASGAALVVASATWGLVPLAFLGLAAFGAGAAAGLQARFAATEVASPGFEARAMSVVLWATTIGSVAGPNLAEAGDAFGLALGLPALVGPFLVSGIVFAASTLLVGALLRLPRAGTLAADASNQSGQAGPADVSDADVDADVDADSEPVAAADPVPGTSARPVSAWRALTIAARSPRSLLALLAVCCSHAVMVGVMVMTPVHLHANGANLGAIGLVLSIHILGMYGASPLMGWLVDRFGAIAVIALGIGILGIAACLGILAPPDDLLIVPLALGLLGLGWSAGLIGGSTLLATTADPALRVPLQGASDAAMNFSAAFASAFSGALLVLGGFAAVNVAALFVLLPLAIVWGRAVALRGGTA